MNAGVTLTDGWVVVPFTGDDTAPAHIGVSAGPTEPTAWQPAFLDWDGAGQRVAKVRPPAGHGVRTAWLRTGSHARAVGSFVT